MSKHLADTMIKRILIKVAVLAFVFFLETSTIFITTFLAKELGNYPFVILNSMYAIGSIISMLIMYLMIERNNDQYVKVCNILFCKKTDHQQNGTESQSPKSDTVDTAYTKDIAQMTQYIDPSVQTKNQSE